VSSLSPSQEAWVARRPSSPYDVVTWTKDDAALARGGPSNIIVPEIAITPASNSTPSLALPSLPESLRRMRTLTLRNNCDFSPTGHLTPTASPQRSPHSTPPSSPKMSISNLVSDIPDEQADFLERELHIRYHERKSLPSQWVGPARSTSPVETVHIDQVPESPTRERPARSISPASSADE
jgi:hypothetical protein